MEENPTNAFYDIIPPTVEENPPIFSDEYIQRVRMLAAIERFASFDEYMEIPGFEETIENDDDHTVCYDDEEYAFQKCGEIEGCYDYSEFYEKETVVPEFDDYFLGEDEDEDEDRGYAIMDISDNEYDREEYDYYYNDPDYLEERRIERLIDRYQDRD